MKVSLKKVYQCDYCQKNMISAGAMARHEKFCRKNPNNMHKCFDTCRFLVRTKELITGKDPFSPYSYVTTFRCKSTGKKMYSFLFEKTVDFKPKYTKGLMRMPLECNMHSYMTESELEERFNPSDE